MKELLGNSTNMALVPQDDGKLKGMAEVILVVTEPIYEVTVGEIIKRRTTETMRFNASVKALRSLAKAIEETADEIEEVERTYTYTPQVRSQAVAETPNVPHERKAGQ